MTSDLTIPKTGQAWNYPADKSATAIIVWADYATVVYDYVRPKRPTERCSLPREAFLGLCDYPEPKRIDRILRNADDTIDEIVMHDCTIHFEQMDHNSYWMSIRKEADPTKEVVVWWTAERVKNKKGRYYTTPSLRVRTTEEDVEWDKDSQHEPWPDGTDPDEEDRKP
jgi:hypothetical protein